MKRIISGCVALVLGVLLCACGSPVYSEPETTEDVPEHGFASAEELLLAVNESKVRKASKEEYRRYYTEGAWNDDEIRAILDENYSEYIAGIDERISDVQSEYGTIYDLICEVTFYEDLTDSTTGESVTQEENEYYKRIFGVDADKVKTYDLWYTLTVKGSKGEFVFEEIESAREIDGRWYAY